MPYKNVSDRNKHQRDYREANKARLWKLLLESSCKDCGEDHPVVLEFDHLPEFVKSFDVSRAVGGSTRSWKRIQEEIDKCEIVCSNCHRKRTAKRGNFYRYAQAPFV